MHRIARTALALGLAATPALFATPAFAATSSTPSTATTGSICGYAWQDTNGDGIRQAGEPAMLTDMGIADTDNYDTHTDAQGHYCITGLPSGTYRVQFNDLSLSGGFAYTKPGRDSAPDWRTGTTGSIDVGVHGAPAEVAGIDVGYVKGVVDQIAQHLTVNGRSRPSRTVTVGQTISVAGICGMTGNVPDYVECQLDLPAGLKIVGTFGDMTSNMAKSDHSVSAALPDRVLPGTSGTLGARVLVTAPFTDDTINLHVWHELYGDSNPADDALSTTISAVAAPPTSTTAPTTGTTAPPASTTTTTTTAAAVPPGHTGGGTGGGSSASLPYTGVSLGVPLAGGAALLTAGTAGLWLTRRRRHRV